MTASSTLEYLVWLLVAASIIAVLVKHLRIPYTVALVIAGLLLSLLRLPILSPLQLGQRPNWLTPDIILFLFLPALVFEGSVKIDVRDLVRDSAPLLLLANFGVMLAMFVTGYVVHWTVGLPILIALLFGAIISATDPVSVLALFKDLRINKRLSTIIEGESLLNDGTVWSSPRSYSLAFWQTGWTGPSELGNLLPLWRVERHSDPLWGTLSARSRKRSTIPR
jgi:CPA1 family monovalent cation:H+ antiporter